MFSKFWLFLSIWESQDTVLRFAKRNCRAQHVFAKSSDFLAGEEHCEVHHKTCKCDADDAEDIFVGTFVATPFTNKDAGQKLSCCNDPDACFFTEKDFSQDLGSNGVGVGWSFGNALVGEFMLTSLLLFSVLLKAVNPDFDFSSLACFALGLAVFLGHSSSFRLLVPHLSDQFFRSSCRVPWISGRKKDTFQHMWGLWFGPQAVVYKLFGASGAPFLHGLHIAQLVTQLMRHQQQHTIPNPTMPASLLWAG